VQIQIYVQETRKKAFDVELSPHSARDHLVETGPSQGVSCCTPPGYQLPIYSDDDWYSDPCDSLPEFSFCRRQRQPDVLDRADLDALDLHRRTYFQAINITSEHANETDRFAEQFATADNDDRGDE
jgi:hypothetical protein